MKTQLFRLAFRVLPFLPRTLLQMMAVLVAQVIWLLASSNRAQVRANLAHIPPLAADPRALERAVRRSFRALLLNYIDLFTPPDLTKPSDLEHITIDNIGVLAKMRDQGCIVLALHSNGFEWGRYYLPHFVKGRFIAPVETVQPPELFALLQHERAKSGIEFLPITEGATLRTMITGLRGGAHVIIALDRDVLHSGVEMPFFGANARIPLGPVALSRITGAPIIIMSLWRTSFRRLEAYVSDPHIIVSLQTRGEAATRQTLAPLVHLIEHEVLRYPEGWLAAFADDIWVTPKAADVAVATPMEAPI